MSQKKRQKRRHSPTVAAKRQAELEKLADEKDRARNRMDPTARLLLFGDLVFLALCQILSSADMLSDLVSGVATVVGAVILLIALWFQFGKKRDNGGGPTLR